MSDAEEFGTANAALTLAQIVLHTLVEKGLLPKAEARAKLKAAVAANAKQGKPGNRDVTFLLRKILEAVEKIPDRPARV